MRLLCRQKEIHIFQPPVRIELTTPGLQDQCSSHWAMEAYIRKWMHINSVWSCYNKSIGTIDLNILFINICLEINISNYLLGMLEECRKIQKAKCFGSHTGNRTRAACVKGRNPNH